MDKNSPRFLILFSFDCSNVPLFACLRPIAGRRRFIRPMLFSAVPMGLNIWVAYWTRHRGAGLLQFCPYGTKMELSGIKIFRRMRRKMDGRLPYGRGYDVENRLLTCAARKLICVLLRMKNLVIFFYERRAIPLITRGRVTHGRTRERNLR